MDRILEINPVNANQLAYSFRHGRWFEFPPEVGTIAAKLKEISRDLVLRVNEKTGAFVVLQILEDGTEHLVTSAQVLDDRIVNRVKRIAHENYDLAAELERVEREADKAREDKFTEQVGEAGERLAHAIRKDLGEQRRIHVPRSI